MNAGDAPRLTGAQVVGVRPGTPLRHEITATGAQPRTYSAALPAELKLDTGTGRLTGTLSEPGEHMVRVAVANAHGRHEATLRIVANDRLALAPPMGWMSWNMFGRQIDERLIVETAEAVIATGMHDAGYEYVCIDDHWHGGRDDAGRLFAHPGRFPSGIAALAREIHGRGLKLGIYSDAAELTCGGEPGSYGFERNDAETFASWGVDYLKYDYCHAPVDRETAVRRYSAMSSALAETDRSIVFAICEWGVRQPWLWAADAGGHLWRTTPDIQDAWTLAGTGSGFVGIVDALDRQVGLEAHAGRGWHDPDMLVAGLNGRGAEYRSQVALWAILGAPLLVSCDLREIDETTLATLTNAEIIAIDQDPLALPGRRLGADGAVEIWVRPLDGGALAVALLNRSDRSQRMEIALNRVGLSPEHRIRDPWGDEATDIVGRSLAGTIGPHATRVLVGAAGSPS